MIYLTLCVLALLTCPLVAQNVLPSGLPRGVDVSRGGNDGSNNWPSSRPTVRPTPTPIPGGDDDCDGDHDHDHDHNNNKKVKIETNMKIQKFTINVGKIEVDIEKRQHKNKHDGSVPAISPPDTSSTSSSSASADDEDAVSNTLTSLINVPGSNPGGPIMGGRHDGDKNVKIDTNIKIVDFTINVGKIKVDVNKCKNEHNNKPPHWPGSPLGNDTAIFPDDPVSAEPGSDEVVLGEGDVSTQGIPPIGGGVVSTGPVIYSFTYKISSEQNGPQQVVTFIIRGVNFDISSLLGVNEADLSDGLGSLLEPRVFLGAIPLKVVKFTDSYIEARFEDIDDQKSFKAGSYLVRVKILHVEHKIGILSTEGSSDISTLGGLSLPELGIIGSGLPILPGIQSPITSPFPLISLFNGFQFDVATLTATFSQADADKIAKAAKAY